MSENAKQHEYPFITNRGCKYFPCHEGLDPDDFNCLFCYCPLYALGPDCGGSFHYNQKGTKVCTDCYLPHAGDAGTKLVKRKWPLIQQLAREKSLDETSTKEEN